jgi:hypothetical protein
VREREMTGPEIYQIGNALFMGDRGRALVKDTIFYKNTNEYERWKDGVFSGNIRRIAYSSVQTMSEPQTKPTDEESHIRLTIVDEKYGTRDLVATQTLAQFLGRHNKFVEFFTTRPDDGTKIGVSIEWVRRDQIYLTGGTTDKEIEKLGPRADKAFHELARTGQPQTVDTNGIREDEDKEEEEFDEEGLRVVHAENMEDGFPKLVEAVQRLYDAGYDAVDISTGIDEEGHFVVRVRPREKDEEEK